MQQQQQQQDQQQQQQQQGRRDEVRSSIDWLLDKITVNRFPVLSKATDVRLTMQVQRLGFRV